MNEKNEYRASILESAEKMRGAAGLACVVKIYVPGTNGVNTSADNTRHIESAARLLSDSFGGCTAMPVSGFWLSDSVGLVRESVTIVYAFCDPASLGASVDAVLDFCESMKKELGQEAISLEVNNVLYFI